jgi:hypothetical protein
MMILIERISGFLREHPKGAFCDPCLRELLDVSSVERVSRFTTALAASREFESQTTPCSFCGQQKQTLKAAPESFSHPLELVDWPPFQRVQA